MSEVQIYKQIFSGDNYIFVNDLGLTVINNFFVISPINVYKNDSLYYEFLIYDVIIEGEEETLIAKINTTNNAIYGKQLDMMQQKELGKLFPFPYTSGNNLRLKVEKHGEVSDILFQYVLIYNKED